MAYITVKFPQPQNDNEAAQLFAASFCPAFYLPESDTIVLTKRLCQIGYKEQFFDILGHEYLHKVLTKLEGKEASEGLDNLDLNALDPFGTKIAFDHFVKEMEKRRWIAECIHKQSENTERLLEYYHNARELCKKNGYGDVVKDVQERLDLVAKTGDCHADAEEFVLHYIYAVFNSGISNKAAESMYRKFLESKLDLSTIKHEKKRVAITEALKSYRTWYHEFTSLECCTVELKLKFLGTLPFCGKANQFLIMRNLGFDVVKPDVHLVRLTKVWGFRTPTDLCKEIQKYTGEYLGVIDLILWYYCSQTRKYNL